MKSNNQIKSLDDIRTRRRQYRYLMKADELKLRQSRLALQNELSIDRIKQDIIYEVKKYAFERLLTKGLSQLSGLLGFLKKKPATDSKS